MKNFGLTIVLLTFFLFTLAGHLVAGYWAHNEDRISQGQAPYSSVMEYAGSGHFLSSVSENMESEFLQMALLVYLTIHFVQKGSAESNKPDDEKTQEDWEEEAAEEAYSAEKKRERPLLWRIYESSLSLSLFSLFSIFFFLHACGSRAEINEERLRTGKQTISFFGIFVDTQFWFESFQNWQSEFFSIAMLGVLSIFLRQKNSAQSKNLRAPHWKTGD